MRTKPREFPTCSVCLAVCAAVAHVLALGGNLGTAASVEALGRSTDGWSAVGMGLADSLSSELDHHMGVAVEGMTKAIEVWDTARRHVEEVLSAGHVLQLPRNESGAGGNPSARSKLSHAALTVGRALKRDLEHLLKAIKPVLRQLQRWLESFGDRLQHAIEDFSVGLDIAQKVFDQVMSHVGGTAGDQEEMLRQTYELFDVSNSGGISVEDLMNVSVIYSITALQGDKARELFERYDADGDGAIGRQEFALLVGDVSIPGAMVGVLRAYARRLAAVSGEVAAARTRDEVARAVADYLSIICVKNDTKMDWVAQAFTNGSLPVEFTAGVLVQLAIAKESPEQLTTTDVGEELVKRMAAHSPGSVAENVDLLADAAYWESEGLDPERQESCAGEVSRWAAGTEDAQLLLRSLHAIPADRPPAPAAAPPEGDGVDEASALLQMSRRAPRDSGRCDAAERAADGRCHGAPEGGADSGEEEVALLQAAQRPWTLRSLAEERHRGQRPQLHGRGEVLLQLQALPSMAREAARRSRYGYERQQRLERSSRRQAFAAMQAAIDLHRPGLFLAFGGEDPEAKRVAKSNAPAQPETLRFAAWLAKNASLTARACQGLCFDYSLQSSSTADSTAQLVSKVAKRFDSVLDTMARYATPQAISRLEDVIAHAVSTLEEDVLDGLDALAAGNLSDFAKAGSGGSLTRGLSLLSTAWDEVAKPVGTLASQLPAVVEDLKRARKRVAAASSSLDLLFGVFGEKGPPVFADAAVLYRRFSVLYFALFFSMTLGLLLHAFYVAGYGFGQPEPAEGEEAAAEYEAEYEAPRSFWQRCRVCCAGCLACMSSCEDTAAFFWSVMLLLEVLWLAMFLVVYLFVLVFGVKVFLSTGCKPVYILGDESLCSEALEAVSGWLGARDWVAGNQAIESVCGSRDLLVCDIIGNKLGTSILLTGVADVVAALLAFQLIVESAVMHERRRFQVLMAKL